MNIVFNILNIWKDFLSQKKFFLEFSLTVIFSIFFAFLFREFLVEVESWEHSLGVFKDPFFISKAIDLSTPIFIMTYGVIGFFILFHLKEPIKLTNLMQITIILLSLRVVTLYFVRLDADPDMIILTDPFLNTFLYQVNEQTGTYNQHDLFFSGHTANLFVASMLCQNKKLKYIFLIVTFIMGTCLVLQRAHYSIDVIFAPFFSLMALFLHKKIKSSI